MTKFTEALEKIKEEYSDVSMEVIVERLSSPKAHLVASTNGAGDIYMNPWEVADMEYLRRYHIWLIRYALTGETGAISFPDEDKDDTDEG